MNVDKLADISALRVAIKNCLKKLQLCSNENAQYSRVIKKLKRENAELASELAQLKRIIGNGAH